MNSNESLTRASLLIKNSILSFGSRIIPLFIGIATIPILIELLGVTRFGILTLAWVFIGYANIFDFGLSRAGIKFISDCIGENKQDEIPSIFWSLTIVLLAIGMLIGSVLYMSSSHVTPYILDSKGELEFEVLYLIRIVAITLPIVLLTSGLNAYLTAYQSFKRISSIQVVNGILNYLAPVVILLFYDGLIAVIITLFFIKLLVFGLYLHSLWQLTEDDLSTPTFSMTHMRELAKYGGWVSISNVISPLVDYIDRFYIAFLIGASVVAFFTTPMDVLLKLGIIPVSIVPVLFPAISGLHKTDKDKAVRFTIVGSNLTLVVLFPVTVLLILFAEELLYLWVGSEFAENSMLIAQILVIGVYLKSFTNYSITYLHGVGKPKQTALVHLGEAVIYFFVLFYAVKEFGLTGAALVHTLRLAVDYYLMNMLTYRYALRHRNGIVKSVSFISIGSLLLILLFFIDSMSLKIFLGAIIIPGSVLVCWLFLVDEEAKKTLLNQLPDSIRKR